jgi:hypothetical protein
MSLTHIFYFKAPVSIKAASNAASIPSLSSLLFKRSNISAASLPQPPELLAPSVSAAQPPPDVLFYTPHSHTRQYLF